jgi:hypothetical protein
MLKIFRANYKVCDMHDIPCFYYGYLTGVTCTKRPKDLL